MLCCQQLQPLPNVGRTIACYLGYVTNVQDKSEHFLEKHFTRFEIHDLYILIIPFH